LTRLNILVFCAATNLLQKYLPPRIMHTDRRQYPKLQGLRTVWEQAQATNESLDLRKLIHIKEGDKKKREHIVNRIAECNEYLKKIERASAKSKGGLRTKPRDLTDKHLGRRTPNLTSSQIREHAKLFHNLLTQYWKCQGHRPHTATRLRLATHFSPDVDADVQFGMLFSTNSEPKPRWQEGEVRINVTKRCDWDILIYLPCTDLIHASQRPTLKQFEARPHCSKTWQAKGGLVFFNSIQVSLNCGSSD
jgi:hypothetical protein